MNPCLRFLSMLALGLMLLGTGCSRNDRLTFTAEESEPSFENGRQLIRQGRSKEALSAFLKVIAERGDQAPESHLEAGLIYRQHIKDQIAAIYHFRKYIELQPNSRQADLVRQQIDAAIREFARTLPAHPLEDSSVKLGYIVQVERLQRENDQLKAEITALRAGILSNPAPIRSYSQGSFNGANSQAVVQPTLSDTNEAYDDAGPNAEPSSPFLSAPLNEEQTRTAQPRLRTTVQTPALAPAPQAQAPTPQPVASARKHTVAKGDTLSAISQRYYGTRTRVKEIINANSDVLKGSDRLSIGMELRIP